MSSLILEHHLFDGRAASSFFFFFFFFYLHRWHVNLSQSVLMLYVRLCARSFGTDTSEHDVSANEVRSVAMVDARRRGLRAKMIADVLKDTAYIQAMEQLFLDLNITIMEHWLSLMLMLAFRDVGQQLHLQHKQLRVRRQLSDQVLAVVSLVWWTWH